MRHGQVLFARLFAAVACAQRLHAALRPATVTCHMSHVTCHMSHVTCHMSHVSCHTCHQHATPRSSSSSSSPTRFRPAGDASSTPPLSRSFSEEPSEACEGSEAPALRVPHYCQSRFPVQLHHRLRARPLAPGTTISRAFALAAASNRAIFRGRKCCKG
jgi:hypothetical protein